MSFVKGTTENKKEGTMKILKYSIFCLLLFATYILPQGKEEETAWRVEIFLGFDNCPQPNSYVFNLDKVGTVWAANHDFELPGFFINEDPDIDNSV
jgi:hypothetical protein